MRLPLIASFMFATLAAVPVFAIERVDGPPVTLRDEFTWRGYREFTTADGLPNQTILALAQGGDGRIYAGTDAGLARYDGVRWVEVALPSGHTPQVWSLLADGDNGLLVGTWNDGLLRLDLASGEIARIEAEDLRAPILDLVASSPSRYWVANGGELQHCQATRCATYAPTVGLPVYRVLPTTFADKDVLWLGLDGEGVRRVDDPLSASARLSEFVLTKADGLPNGSVRALARWGGARGDDLWIGCGRGIARWNGERLSVYGAGNGFPTAMVFDFQAGASVSGNPQLYATLRPGGLATFRDDGTWILQGTATGVPSNDLHTLMISKQGSSSRSLWIGTVDAGIARRDPGQFSLIDERYGLPSRYVHGLGEAVFADGERNFWVGSVAGARRWRAGRWQEFVPEAFADRVVRDVIGSGMRLWIATDRQLLRVEGDQVTEYNLDNSALPAVGVNALAMTGAPGDETLYVATGHGLARWRANDGLVRLQPADGSEYDEIISVATDATNGAVWIAEEQQVRRLVDGAFARVDVTCLKDDRIYDMRLHTGHDGVARVWLATRNGVVRLEADHPEQCRLDAIADELGVVGGLIVDEADRLFAFGSRRALRMPVAVADLEDARVERFDRSDGLASPQLHPGRHLWQDNEGRIYAATANGLVGYEPEPAFATSDLPRLLLTDAVRGDGQPFNDGDAIPPSLNAVRFSYRLLHYDREHRIRYRVALDGLAKGSAAWSASPQQSYERLPAGDYRFVVIARAADGRESAPVAHAFRVLAPWWQRAWAVLLFATMLVASGLAFGRWRARAAESRALVLEREVHARTRELAAANAQLEHAALTDPLTGLGNRRHFAIATNGEIERARRRVTARDAHAYLLVMMIDIDHFKRVNDDHGHAAGDEVLVTLAARIAGLCRAADIAARIGGEEFVLIARDIEAAAAPQVLQRTLHALADAPIAAGSHTLALTVSIGAVLVPGTDEAVTTIESVLVMADDALYTAKQLGRDRACLVDEAGEVRTIGQRRARVFQRSQRASE